MRVVSALLVAAVLAVAGFLSSSSAEAGWYGPRDYYGWPSRGYYRPYRYSYDRPYYRSYYRPYYRSYDRPYYEPYRYSYYRPYRPAYYDPGYSPYYTPAYYPPRPRYDDGCYPRRYRVYDDFGGYYVRTRIVCY